MTSAEDRRDITARIIKLGLWRAVEPRKDRSPHTPEIIGHVKDLWDAGASVKGIAERLGLGSRNVVIGIAHRNNFPARPSPIRRVS